MLTLESFQKEFEKEVTERNINWEMKGFYGADGRLYGFGTDTKVISTVFEAFCGPLIIDIAHRHKYEVAFAKQTVYPDFTLIPPGKLSDLIAVDVKTTYQKSSRDKFGFTLGSYTSFLRNGTKNILFPYNQYCTHWIIGFVYCRIQGIAAKAFASSEKPDEISCPYNNVRYFIQEKYKVSGLKPGSGNTANIGSIKSSNLEDFSNGNGPFAKTGEGSFEKYWREYKK